MKNYTNLILFISILFLLLFGVFSLKSCQDYKKECEQLKEYISHYEDQNMGKDAVITELEMTTKHLAESKDSLNQKLDSVRKALSIKEKDLKRIEYIKEYITFTDTVLINDDHVSIFSNFDTTIYYNEQTKFSFCLNEPNIFIMTPKIENELYVVSSYKKEFVNTPSKWWIVRLFQKKRKVVEVDVENSNDLVKTEQTRFINIIK